MLEVFGVGMIFPAITIITGNEINFLNFDLRYYINEITLSYNLSNELTVLIALIVFFFFKILLHDFFTWYQARFIESYNCNISKFILKIYLC